ncbi:MAG TPA: class I SAM-dependent methyltransferase [Methylophilaceae bacterium]|nr:class I SAM-dependent methyltransferase [Methylophilaceae bacterium]
MSTRSTDDQFWDPQQYAENARFVSDLGMSVVELLAPQPGERILDLGCGDGALTVKLQALGCNVLGVDASVSMVEAARKLGLDARVMDGRALPFQSEFDAVFSNAALHWMPDPEAVIVGVWRALKPGGRFVGEFGGHGNVAKIVSTQQQVLTEHGFSAENPWFFPRPEEYQQLLETQGFRVLSIQLVPRPTRLPGDISGWLRTFGHQFLEHLRQSDRDSVLSAAVGRLRPQLCDATGAWYADYVRLRFHAVRPA